MKAVICPVCKGTGQVFGQLTPTVPQKCHGCDGKGWVEVQEDPVDIKPYILPNPVYWPCPNITWRYSTYPALDWGD